VSELEGLIKFDIETRTPTFLLKGINGQNFAALNNLCIDEENQIIYVTDATSISMRFSTKEVLLKHRKGRIISYNLSTSVASVVLADLAFPNGIVYEKSTSSIIFSELNRNRIIRYYVDGPKNGTQEIIIDNLFGFGDNLKLNEKGELLVAIPATRDDLLDYLTENAYLRKYLMYLPERLFSIIAKKRAGGIKIDTKTG
jgi:sugar lactone lactonase YvrE